MAKCDICGKEMLRAYGCSAHTLIIDNNRYTRVRYGEEGWMENPERCGDCGVKLGYFHHLGCDIERCPKCFGQLITCDCEDAKIIIPSRRRKPSA